MNILWFLNQYEYYNASLSESYKLGFQCQIEISTHTHTHTHTHTNYYLRSQFLFFFISLQSSSTCMLSCMFPRAHARLGEQINNSFGLVWITLLIWINSTVVPVIVISLD